MRLISWFEQLIRIQYPGPPHILGCWGASHSEVSEGTVYSFWSGTTLEAPTINWSVSLRDGRLCLVYSCCYSPLTFWKLVLLLRTKPGPDWVALSVLGPRSGWRLRCLLSFSLSCTVKRNDYDSLIRPEIQTRVCSGVPCIDASPLPVWPLMPFFADLGKGRWFYNS